MTGSDDQTPAAGGGGARPFEIVREFEAEATPAQVWDAFTTGTAGWLWPMVYEPREGGAAPFGGTVTRWDPPRRLTGRVADPEGVPGQTLNQLDHLIEPRDGGARAWVRYVHSGVFTGDGDEQYDAADKHTDFYLHTLRQYLIHFTGRPAAFSTLNGPPASADPGALAVADDALGLPEDVAEGARIRAEGPQGEVLDAVVDFRTPYFTGLRTETALIRLFGRGAFGAPLGISVHDFAQDADAKLTGQRWGRWLDELFG